jgi:hypothetical protein
VQGNREVRHQRFLRELFEARQHADRGQGDALCRQREDRPRPPGSAMPSSWPHSCAAARPCP